MNSRLNCLVSILSVLPKFLSDLVIFLWLKIGWHGLAVIFVRVLMLVSRRIPIEIQDTKQKRHSEFKASWLEFFPPPFWSEWCKSDRNFNVYIQVNDSANETHMKVCVSNGKVRFCILSWGKIENCLLKSCPGDAHWLRETEEWGTKTQIFHNDKSLLSYVSMTTHKAECTNSL